MRIRINGLEICQTGYIVYVENRKFNFSTTTSAWWAAEVLDLAFDMTNTELEVVDDGVIVHRELMKQNGWEITPVLYKFDERDKDTLLNMLYEVYLIGCDL